MSRVKLSVLEISREDYYKIQHSIYELPMGSHPKREEDGQVEGMIVPKDKVWLFPIGNDFNNLIKALPQGMKTLRKEFFVNV